MRFWIQSVENTGEVVVLSNNERYLVMSLVDRIAVALWLAGDAVRVNGAVMMNQRTGKSVTISRIY